MALEDHILSYLCKHQGYEEGHSCDYDKEYAVDCGRVKRFLVSTQRAKTENTACFASASDERKFFAYLSRQLSERGVTDVLRKGIRYLAEHFDMYYPLPSELNPSAQEAYRQNIFAVTKELCYSKVTDNRLDMMVSINGLPLITMELKNHYTGQTVQDAIHQYKHDRLPAGEPLLQTKRCAVHLAVDDDEIMMCTALAGSQSWFLPFNKGVRGGAGNPVRDHGVRTAYLWEEILEKHSLSDIIENYAQVVKKSSSSAKGTGKQKESSETVVWPRYHQLDAVRQLLAATRQGVGQHFLIQHSAGSGKSNTITWLAYQLVNLLAGTRPLIDSVIVVTDRVNLDNQIRDNITSFRRLTNIVAWADSAAALREALADGKKIIITIIHKFPFILDAIGGEMSTKHFAIIIDEAHSSQSGSLAAKMNLALSGNGTGSDEDDLEDILNRLIDGRKMMRNANYYAFTATPKNKTLEMFGTAVVGADGEKKFRPFHEYSMKQAIEEGFIMDVLRNYTTYKSFYQVVKSIPDDPEYDKKQAQKKIRAWVESRPETIEQKAKIIVTHFHTMVLNKGKIGGQARAMVVTSSILRAIEFYYAISRLLQDRGSQYKAVVAFSGTKEYGGKEVTEADINGFPSSEIEARIAQDPYRILVVADKFQTGYDQPLLHSMYVDKVLTSVKAVQTLSRLNRCHPKKIDTFVLDFANSEDDIINAFQTYYKTTILSKETDVNKLNDLITEIEEVNIYTEEEVEDIVKKYFSGVELNELDPKVNIIVDRFKRLTEEQQVNTKSCIKAFIRTYPFIAAVTPYRSQEWEKLYIFYTLLVRKLPKLRDEDLTQGLLDAIDLHQLRVTKQDERNLSLENHDTEIEPIPVGGGAAIREPEPVKLSDILNEFNNIHWQDIAFAKQQLDTLPEKILHDTAFVNAARNSTRNTALQQFNSSMMTIVANMLNINSEFCRNYLDNPAFMNFINSNVFENVYRQVQQDTNR